MSSKTGFTLVELLVVIAVLTILLSIGISTFRGAQERARDSQRKSDLRALATALEGYYQKNGQYIDGTPVSNGDCSDLSAPDSSTFYSSIAPFMANQKVPKDPSTDTNYCYISEGDGKSFRLFAKLENCSGAESPLCQYTNFNYSIVSQDLNIEPATGDILIPTPTPAPTPVVLPPPIAYWALDEASGNTAVDSSGNNKNAALINNPVWTTGHFGNGLQFDGFNDFAVTGTSVLNPAASDFTVAGWFKLDVLGRDQAIVSQENGTGLGRIWLRVDAANKLGSYLGGTSSQGNTALSAGIWYHGALVKEDSTLTFYLNGAFNGSATKTIQSADGKTRLGIDKLGGSAWDGILDEVRIYNQALSGPAIALLYSLTPPPAPTSAPTPTPVPGLAAHWKYDDSSGTNASDTSGNGNNASLINGPVWTAGFINGGLQFDGANDYTATGTNVLNPSSTDFSVTAWFKLNRLGVNQSIVSQENGVGIGRIWLFVTSANKLGSRLGGSLTEANTNLTTGIWYHGALVKQGSTINFYLNGNLENSGTKTVESATGNTRTGADKFGTDALNGTLDDIRIYNRALSPSEIQAIFNLTL